jgi:hypothetical protein
MACCPHPQDADLIMIEYSVNGCVGNIFCHNFASPRVSSVAQAAGNMSYQLAPAHTTKHAIDKQRLQHAWMPAEVGLVRRRSALRLRFACAMSDVQRQPPTTVSRAANRPDWH